MTDQNFADRVCWVEDVDGDGRIHVVIWPVREIGRPNVTLCGRDLDDFEDHDQPSLGSICPECVKRLLERVEAA